MEEEELDLDLEGGNTRNNNSVLSSSSTPKRPSQPPAPTITVSVPGKNSRNFNIWILVFPMKT